jgi:hypothetical protein
MNGFVNGVGVRVGFVFRLILLLDEMNIDLRHFVAEV